VDVQVVANRRGGAGTFRGVEKQPLEQDQREMMLHFVAIISTHRDDKFFDKTKSQQRPAETDRANQWPS
jgi:hypothetical protein